MNKIQNGVILPTPKHGRYLRFDLRDASALAGCLQRLATMIDGKKAVVGLGLSCMQALPNTAQIEGLRAFPLALRSNGLADVPPAALWCWLRGSERGDLLHESLQIQEILRPAFDLRDVVDAFTHQSGRDLTGYEDGTENPKGNAALAAAFVNTSIDGLHGGSFVAVQQWQHLWPAFHAMSRQAQDHAIGRERVSNEELDDAPSSAHVKRTAQEGFEPEAFVLRRSMSWVAGQDGGLMFVAFGRSFDAFEAQWQRMLGLDDGILDGLFQFSQPLGHDYYWCPPMLDGRLNLCALGL